MGDNVYILVHHRGCLAKFPVVYDGVSEEKSNDLQRDLPRIEVHGYKSNIIPAWVQGWASVEDAGPTLNLLWITHSYSGALRGFSYPLMYPYWYPHKCTGNAYAHQTHNKKMKLDRLSIAPPEVVTLLKSVLLLENCDNRMGAWNIRYVLNHARISRHSRWTLCCM